MESFNNNNKGQAIQRPTSSLHTKTLRKMRQSYVLKSPSLTC